MKNEVADRTYSARYRPIIYSDCISGTIEMCFRLYCAINRAVSSRAEVEIGFNVSLQYSVAQLVVAR